MGFQPHQPDTSCCASDALWYSHHHSVWWKSSAGGSQCLPVWVRYVNTVAVVITGAQPACIVICTLRGCARVRAPWSSAWAGAQVHVSQYICISSLWISAIPLTTLFSKFLITSNLCLYLFIAACKVCGKFALWWCLCVCGAVKSFMFWEL